MHSLPYHQEVFHWTGLAGKKLGTVKVFGKDKDISCHGGTIVV